MDTGYGLCFHFNDSQMSLMPFFKNVVRIFFRGQIIWPYIMQPSCIVYSIPFLSSKVPYLKGFNKSANSMPFTVALPKSLAVIGNKSISER